VGVLDHLQILQSEEVAAASAVAKEVEEAELQVLDVVVTAVAETTETNHNVKSDSNMDTLLRDAGIDLVKTMFMSKGKRGTQ
jgi:hypothetical protein